MDTSNRPASVATKIIDTLLGILLVLAMGITAVMLGNSWGGAYWLPDLVVSVIVSALVLLRHRDPVMMAAAGLVVAIIAIIAAGPAGLPHEPGPAVVLALAILTGAALRVASGPAAAGISAGSIAVVVAAWIADGFRVASALATVGCVAAIAVGMSLQAYTGRSQTPDGGFQTRARQPSPSIKRSDRNGTPAS